MSEMAKLVEDFNAAIIVKRLETMTPRELIQFCAKSIRLQRLSIHILDKKLKAQCAGWRSPVARKPHKLQAVGSNPIPASKLGRNR